MSRSIEALKNDRKIIRVSLCLHKEIDAFRFSGPEQFSADAPLILLLFAKIIFRRRFDLFRCLDRSIEAVFSCEDLVFVMHVFLPALKLPQASRILPETYYHQAFSSSRFDLRYSDHRRSAQPSGPHAMSAFQCSSRLFLFSFFHVLFPFFLSLFLFPLLLSFPLP